MPPGTDNSDAASEPWYEKWFDRSEYELVYRQRDEQEAVQCVDLIEEAAQPEPGSEILDMGCGRGRHARVLAKRGYRVTGVDLSRESLRKARKLSEEQGLDITFQHGDMRDHVCDACVDGAVNLFTAFGYFDDDEEHVQALRVIADALRDNGWFVQDFLNAAYAKATLVPHDVKTVRGITISQRRWVEDGRINKKIQLVREGRTQTFHESVRLFSRVDFERLYDRVGLEVESSYGHYDGRPYRPDSPRLILVSRKR